MKRKITLVICLIIIITGIWLVPDHGPIAETIDSSDNAKHTTVDVIVYKPWKEDEIIQEIQDRKKLLNEVPDTMTIHMHYISRKHKYKTITITYNSPESISDTPPVK